MTEVYISMQNGKESGFSARKGLNELQQHKEQKQKCEQKDLNRNRSSAEKWKVRLKSSRSEGFGGGDNEEVPFGG